jgi:hypothetical protein
VGYQVPPPEKSISIWLAPFAAPLNGPLLARLVMIATTAMYRKAPPINVAPTKLLGSKAQRDFVVIGNLALHDVRVGVASAWVEPGVAR